MDITLHSELGEKVNRWATFRARMRDLRYRAVNAATVTVGIVAGIILAILVYGGAIAFGVFLNDLFH